MDLHLLKRNWEAFGRDDPLWAVLTDPSRRGGRWDPEEFLATGEREVADMFRELDELGISVAGRRALDFGCGAGRLTQALADRFDRCDGVDIAASMVGEAERLNRHGDRVRFHVNQSADLALFAGETFDFVLSYIVLQHMESRYAKRYIAEFAHVLIGLWWVEGSVMVAANNVVWPLLWRPRSSPGSGRRLRSKSGLPGIWLMLLAA